jgi:hypothetical protein
MKSEDVAKGLYKVERLPKGYTMMREVAYARRGDR